MALGWDAVIRRLCLTSLLLATAPWTLRADDVEHPYTWTVLIPAQDSRDVDQQTEDEMDSRSLVDAMNAYTDAFHHGLVWNEVSIRNLLSDNAPFCELRFDAVKPLVLTDDEKDTLRQYFVRGGFVLLQQDAYPYAEDEFWKVKSWPVVDFLTKELPAIDPDFTVQKITDAFPVFHQYYETRTADAVMHELQGNPNTPNRTLLYYKDRPCALVWGRYSYLVDGKWAAAPRPFVHDYSYDHHSFELVCNIYIYAMTH